MAEIVRVAFSREDLSAVADLLDAHVTWGAAGARRPSCTTKAQVLTWFQTAWDAGVRARTVDVCVAGERVLVTLVVRGSRTARERGGGALRYQILTFRNGRIVDIAGFDDRESALAFAQM
jgi:ketosteroid isomerase-like protein